MNDERDQIDTLMESELNNIADMMDGKTYNSYGDFEDEVSKLINEHCPVCKSEINKVKIGIFPFMGNIRNYIRSRANIEFE